MCFLVSCIWQCCIYANAYLQVSAVCHLEGVLSNSQSHWQQNLAWLRQSVAAAQPWLLLGRFVPSQTFPKFLGCGIGTEFARSERPSSELPVLLGSPPRTCSSPLGSEKLLDVVDNKTLPVAWAGTAGVRARGWSSCSRACDGDTRTGRRPLMQPPACIPVCRAVPRGLCSHSIAFCSARFLVFVRHQPHCVQPAQELLAPHPCRGDQRRRHRGQDSPNLCGASHASLLPQCWLSLHTRVWLLCRSSGGSSDLGQCWPMMLSTMVLSWGCAGACLLLLPLEANPLCFVPMTTHLHVCSSFSLI